MRQTPPTPPPSQTVAAERRVWDAALKPAQARAQRGRADLADARRRRLISAWLRELANR